MDRKTSRPGTTPEGPEALLSLALDRRIVEMRMMLSLMRPTTTASALQALRDAFPDVPLVERLRILAETRH